MSTNHRRESIFLLRSDWSIRCNLAMLNHSMLTPSFPTGKTNLVKMWLSSILKFTYLLGRLCTTSVCMFEAECILRKNGWCFNRLSFNMDLPRPENYWEHNTKCTSSCESVFMRQLADCIFQNVPTKGSFAPLISWAHNSLPSSAPTIN